MALYQPVPMRSAGARSRTNGQFRAWAPRMEGPTKGDQVPLCASTWCHLGPAATPWQNAEGQTPGSWPTVRDGKAVPHRAWGHAREGLAPVPSRSAYLRPPGRKRSGVAWVTPVRAWPQHQRGLGLPPPSGAKKARGLGFFGDPGARGVAERGCVHIGGAWRALAARVLVPEHTFGVELAARTPGPSYGWRKTNSAPPRGATWARR